MSTDRIHGEVVFTCDDCDDTLETGEHDFEAARQVKLGERWGSRQVGGRWLDLCPDCYSPKAAFKRLDG